MFGLENTHTILNHCSVSLYWENTSNWDSFKKKKKKEPHLWNKTTSRGKNKTVSHFYEV